MKIVRKCQKIASKYPIIRGVISYAAICPAGCLIQQTYDGKNLKNCDWSRVFRFSCYGVFVVAPMIHGWVRLASFIWPQESFRSAVKKALLEQVTYAPLTMFCFYTLMPIIEGKNLKSAIEEHLKPNFLPTYKMAVCYWPFVQTLNFSLIPARNRVPFVSACSLLWWIFLAHMHKKKSKINVKDKTVYELNSK